MASPFWSTNPTPGNLESTCTMIPLQVLDSICDSTYMSCCEHWCTDLPGGPNGFIYSQAQVTQRRIDQLTFVRVCHRARELLMSAWSPLLLIAWDCIIPILVNPSLSQLLDNGMLNRWCTIQKVILVERFVCSLYSSDSLYVISSLQWELFRSRNLDTAIFTKESYMCIEVSYFFVVLRDTTSPMSTTPGGTGQLLVGEEFRPSVYRPAIVILLNWSNVVHIHISRVIIAYAKRTAPALCHANATIIIVIICLTTCDAYWILSYMIAIVFLGILFLYNSAM